MSSTPLIFFINGEKVVETNPDPEWTLLFYLRNKVGLCGTKLGCGEGGCGACTVMVSRLIRDTGHLQHIAINACLAPVCSLHGLAVTTVEGIGSTKKKLHPVQERLALSHGSQCGFCTPGMVMSMYALLRSSSKPSIIQLEETLQGNLCRCTGYRPIIEGFRSFVEECGNEDSCALQNGTNGCCRQGTEDMCCKDKPDFKCMREVTDQLVPKNQFTPYDPTQEPIFPPELKLSDELDRQALEFHGNDVTWYRPLNLDQLLQLKEDHPEAQIVIGSTKVLLDIKFKGSVYPVRIHPSLVFELMEVQKEPGVGLIVGAAVSLSEVQKILRQEIEQQPRHVTRVFVAVHEMLHWFAGKQIRNVSSVGSNIMTSSPTSDLNTIWLAAGCELRVQSKQGGPRSVRMDHTFFTSYHKNVLRSDEVLLSICIPYTSEHQYFAYFKQSKRRELDAAIVNAAFNVQLRSTDGTIEHASLAFGGMASTTVLARDTSELLVGRPWNEDTLHMTIDSLAREMALEPGALGGMVRYRQSLVSAFFFKFFLTVQQERGLSVKPRDASATTPYHSELPSGSQYFELVPEGQPLHDLVGRPLPHLSAFKHTTGEAEFCDDVPCAVNEFYLSHVTSTRAHARLLRVDAKVALAVPGVVAFFSARDLEPERNRYGLVMQDEEIFASSKVTSQGQVIGAIVATSNSLAQKAAKLVEIEYEDLEPVIVTLQEAISNNSFYELPYKIKYQRGDAVTEMSTSEHVLEGEVHVGGQEHFYMETNCARVVPGREDNELEIYSPNQMLSEVQERVAHMLGLPINRITCKTRRCGGAFGGKETKCLLVVLPLALAASKLRRPVRCVLERCDDMLMTGGRNPMLGRYKVGVTRDGRLRALDLSVYANAGHNLDLSSMILNRTLLALTNSYQFENISLQGYVCRTNLPSNSSFRGFGTPQSIVICETIIEDVAAELGLDPASIRARNFIKEGDVTHYGQEIVNSTLQRCWEECENKSDFKARQVLTEKFNREHRWKKRGISIVPLTYGCGYEIPSYNQGAALIHIYIDGSVLLAHGGVEMGQGLHTKMIQVASRALGVPGIDVHIAETCTASVPNTIPSAASISSDLNGMAILNACDKLLKRLAPYREANPKGTWKDWVHAAFLDCVSLSATGFYKVPGVSMDYETCVGNPYTYFTFGAACSEVEIDCLTGDHQILRTDIVMDLGESINPAIDVGQIEGAFLQGVGMLTMEELLYSPNGTMLTLGPSMYKIPCFSDTPSRFNVTLLRGSSNPRAVYSSKAIGEPPLVLSTSVLCALRCAISSAREVAGLKGRFRLDTPATAERIRLACLDQFIDKVITSTILISEELWITKKPDETAPPSTEEKIASPVTEEVDPNLDGEAKKEASSPTKASKMEMVKNQMGSWFSAGGGLISAVKGRATGEETVPDPPAHLAQTSSSPGSTDPGALHSGVVGGDSKVDEDENSSATEGADSEPQVSEGETEEGKDGAPISAAVGTKAIQGAKTFGNFLYSAVNKAGKTVSEASAKIKKTVEENTILSEFNKEQEAFIKDKQKSMEAAVPPWVGYPNEEKLKEEILSLSQDRRSFVRAPPTGVTFEFDHESFTPVAQALLAEDPELEKMRFELVPKVVNEETFWRNYFYRVSLIKQSNELSSLAQEGGNVNSSMDDATAECIPTPDKAADTSPEGFASDDTVRSSEQERLEALQELRRLGVADESPAAAEWEQELQAELKDFEVVSGGQTTSDNWENDVQDLLDDETDLK